MSDAYMHSPRAERPADDKVRLVEADYANKIGGHGIS